MRRFDVCNGDADGLCAVLQWRRVHPAAATLVTGLKRELDLLQRVPAGAGEFCRRFGGGRAGATGIDHLPDSERERFVTELSAARWGG